MRRLAPAKNHDDQDFSTVNRIDLRSDERGIALQTIIVMVVLLAIAGAVAAVLLNRAGSETDRLENETVKYADHGNKFACDTAGGTWTPGTDGNSDGDTNDTGEGTCGAPSSGVVVVVPNPAFNLRTTQAACLMETPPGSGVGTWADNNTDGDNDASTMPNDGTCS